MFDAFTRDVTIAIVATTSGMFIGVLANIISDKLKAFIWKPEVFFSEYRQVEVGSRVEGKLQIYNSLGVFRSLQNVRVLIFLYGESKTAELLSHERYIGNKGEPVDTIALQPKALFEEQIYMVEINKAEVLLNQEKTHDLYLLYQDEKGIDKKVKIKRNKT